MNGKLSSGCRFAAAVCALACATTARASDQQARIQRVVDGLRVKLSITQPVIVTMVQTNPSLFSVAPPADRAGTFLLAVEEDFAQELSDAEVEAAVAHELGHVWIFTHFPYLQTEELANEIAARVVSPERLRPLYAKVWARTRKSEAEVAHQQTGEFRPLP